MSTTVSMPQLGESVTEGTVTRWLKNVGDTVAADEASMTKAQEVIEEVAVRVAKTWGRNSER